METDADGNASNVIVTVDKIVQVCASSIMYMYSERVEVLSHSNT